LSRHTFAEGPQMTNEVHDPTDHSKRRAKAALPERADVAIVGAGLGGLMSAAIMAKQGLKVAVLDSHYVAGGCATQFRRRADAGMFNFDVGLHYIGECHAQGKIPAWFKALGAEPLAFRELDPDGFDELIMPGVRFRVPKGIDRYRDRLVETFPSERKGIDRYIRFLNEQRHMVDVTRNGTKAPDARTAIELVMRGRLFGRYMKSSAADLLDSCTKNMELRAVLLGEHGDYGLPPSRVAAVLHAGLVLHYLDGAYYPVGGGQTIADRLAELIESAGGGVYLRRPVESILVRGGRAVGVRTAGTRAKPAEELLADVVISNADIKKTFLELLPADAVPAEWKAKAKRWEMGGALFMTCVGVRGDLRELGVRDANYWQSDSADVEKMYAEINTRDDLPPTRGAFITSASLKDPDSPGHAPEGYQTIEIMSLVPGEATAWSVADDEIDAWVYKHNEAYEAKKQRVEDDMLRRAEELFPGFRERVVYVESASPVTQSRFTRASGGTSYGLAATPEQYMGNRPSARSVIPGFYLAGASTRSGHGIIGALTSGVQAARSVLRDKGKEMPAGF
jgi:phytoene dehydrogenase-like protein